MDKKVFSIVAVVIVLAVIGVIGYVQPWQNGTTTEGAVPSSPASSPLTGASVADIADTVEEAVVEDTKTDLVAADVEYTIVAKDMKFTPSVITAKKGQRVRLHITAEDRTYGFEVAEFYLKDTVYRGETKTVDLVPDKYGTFIFFSRREWNDGKIGELGRIVVSLN